MNEKTDRTNDAEGHAISRRTFIKGVTASAAGAAIFPVIKGEAWGAEMPQAAKGRSLMKVERLEIKGEGFAVPAVLFTPPRPKVVAIVVHGYGGSKEEVLGLAWRIAEKGIAACAIDMRGHGENPLPLGDAIGLDLAAAIRHFRSRGKKVIAVGHSLGARLALLSDADFVIALSPALNSTFSPQTAKLLKELRGYRVRETAGADIFEVFKKLPLYTPAKKSSVLVLYGERDVPEIVQGCTALADQGEKVKKIDRALHADIFLLEPVFTEVGRQIEEWTKKA